VSRCRTRILKCQTTAGGERIAESMFEPEASLPDLSGRREEDVK
jgi:hypothetical protein